MTKKDYEKASEIVRAHYTNAAKLHIADPETAILLACELQRQATAIREAFVALFRGDNDRFDVVRFRDACTKVEIKK